MPPCIEPTDSDDPPPADVLRFPVLDLRPFLVFLKVVVNPLKAAIEFRA